MNNTRNDKYLDKINETHVLFFLYREYVCDMKMHKNDEITLTQKNPDNTKSTWKKLPRFQFLVRYLFMISRSRWWWWWWWWWQVRMKEKYLTFLRLLYGWMSFITTSKSKRAWDLFRLKLCELVMFDSGPWVEGKHKNIKNEKHHGENVGNRFWI
jgi:hypothetical protein